jgi:hypothetical protein
MVTLVFDVNQKDQVGFIGITLHYPDRDRLDIMVTVDETPGRLSQRSRLTGGDWEWQWTSESRQSTLVAGRCWEGESESKSASGY